MATFFWLVNFSYDMKHANVERYVANAKRGHNDVPHIFWSLYEYLFPLLKWRFSSSLNGHIVPIPFFTLAHAIMFTIEPRVVNVFLACSLIFFEHMFLRRLFLKSHLPTPHSKHMCLIKISDRVRSTLSLAIPKVFLWTYPKYDMLSCTHWMGGMFVGPLKVSMPNLFTCHLNWTPTLERCAGSLCLIVVLYPLVGRNVCWTYEGKHA